MLSWFRRSRSKPDPTAVTPKLETTATKEAPTPSRLLAVPTTAHAVAYDWGAMDYLDTPAVAAYFDAREREAYYQALKHIDPRRDFREHLIPVIERFIELTDSPPGAVAVDRVIGKSLRLEQAARGTGNGTALEVVRARRPQGVKLLGLTEPLTFDSLKSAYRSAAKRNHPDAGGSHDTMVMVNEAFQLAHALLRELQIGVGSGVANGAVTVSAVDVTDCAAYRYTCGELLFLVALDDWNIDTAFAWLERITSDLCQQSPYTQDPWRRITLTEPAGKLASRLSTAGLHEQALRALATARTGLREAQSRHLLYEHFVREPEDVLAGRRRAKVVINHKRQADNALRLRLIDASRYHKIVDKLALAAAAEEAYEEQLRQFLAGGGFLRDLPTDRAARGKVPQSELVPEPGYYVNQIQQLSDDQQAEYLVAFSDRSTLQLVRKYTFVRLVSLLASVLFQPGQLDDAAAEREARTLASLHVGGGGFYGTKVADIIAELRDRPAAERQARATALKAIEQGGGRHYDAAGITFTVTLGNLSPLGMPLSQEYFETVTRPIDALRTMQRTGRIPATEEERRDRKAWSRDAGRLRTPEVQAAHKAAFAAIDLARSNPEAALEQLAGYCNLLLDLGRSMVHVQELQLGYWVDRLTVTLVKLKRWHEAFDWLERYFALPPRYRGRSSASEEAGLRKRLARCSEMPREETGTR